MLTSVNLFVELWILSYIPCSTAIGKLRCFKPTHSRQSVVQRNGRLHLKTVNCLLQNAAFAGARSGGMIWHATIVVDIHFGLENWPKAAFGVQEAGILPTFAGGHFTLSEHHFPNAYSRIGA